jgi:NADH:ubiquinone reductase (H+-translocating)
MNMSDTHVLVLGGGYAGVMAANRLARTPGIDVTLLNPRPMFVERIRLHQLATGGDDAVVEFPAVLHPAVRLVVAAAHRIDATARRVEVEVEVETSGADLPYEHLTDSKITYDYLIYAVGSTSAAPNVPGVAEYACSVSEWESAQRLRERLAALGPDQPIVVVGAGLTGIETAAELAETGRAVTLVAPTIGPSLSAGGRRSVVKALTRLGVTLVDGADATVTTVGPDSVTLAGHERGARRLPAALTVWTAGFGVPGLAAASGLSTDAVGRLRTDATLTSVDDPRIVACGDAAAPADAPYRMSCQASLPMGTKAAETVLSRCAGTPPAEVSIPMAAQCVGLGRRAGTLQVQRRDDSATRWFVGGRLAGVIKEQVCRYTVRAMAGEAKR